jgi:hypothetical protein
MFIEIDLPSAVYDVLHDISIQTGLSLNEIAVRALALGAAQAFKE